MRAMERLAKKRAGRLPSPAPDAKPAPPTPPRTVATVGKPINEVIDKAPRYSPALLKKARDRRHRKPSL